MAKVRMWMRSALRWLQRVWWHYLQFPVDSFFKALPLLVLWMLVFLGFVFLVFPLIGLPTEGIGRVLAALLTALVGFGVQQWQGQTEEERERRRMRTDALREIERLRSLIGDQPSEGARRYLDLTRRSEATWKSSRVQAALRDAWGIAPIELRNATRLLDLLQDTERFAQVVQDTKPESSIAALEWAYKHLDDDWQKKALDGLRKLLKLPGHENYKESVSSECLRDMEQRPWRAILQVWPHLSLWRDLPSPADSEVVKALSYLRLERNPFGLGQAETDTLLLTCRTVPPLLGDLRRRQPTLCVGSVGSGKTATALLMAYDGLQNPGRDAFPVYYPTTVGVLELRAIAQVLAQTLLRYLSAEPASFLRQGVAGRTAVSYILSASLCGNLALRFHQAGLPRTGEGAHMIREIETLSRSVSFQEPLTDTALLALLSDARPKGFRYTVVLLDVQGSVGENDSPTPDVFLKTLLDLSDVLARIGVFVKAFLPETFMERLCRHSEQPWTEPRELQWSSDQLQEMLAKRLVHFGVDSLAAWCDPAARDLQPDQRLIERAGSPRKLIELGNALLIRIGERKEKLSARDLDEILGSPQA